MTQVRPPGPALAWDQWPLGPDLSLPWALGGGAPGQRLWPQVPQQSPCSPA